MKIAFIWTGVTSYMADCWRALAAERDVSLRVWIDVSSEVAKAVSFDAAALLRGVDHALVADDSAAAVRAEVAAWRPDIVFAVGWRSPVCRAVVEEPRLAGVPKVCCFDMPWRWELRCLVAPLVLRRFLRHYDAAFVPGAVCARYARWLGFRTIHRGLFAIDTRRFAAVGDEASARGDFVYIGRNSPEKRLDDLRAAHARYRAEGGTRALRLYGKGLEGGFLDPSEVPRILHNAAAFVLASSFDPWPLVLLEAMSAGCPVIASDRCTNRPELGRNWQVFPQGDIAALTRLMHAVDQTPLSPARLDENRALARQYDCAEWVRRVRSCSPVVDLL